MLNGWDDCIQAYHYIQLCSQMSVCAKILMNADTVFCCCCKFMRLPFCLCQTCLEMSAAMVNLKIQRWCKTHAVSTRMSALCDDVHDDAHVSFMWWRSRWADVSFMWWRSRWRGCQLHVMTFTMMRMSALCDDVHDDAHVRFMWWRSRWCGCSSEK